ncbi:MAG TPA: hypothetical protein VHW01_28390, partial [Polyangiaceae bacterium]|nr:hypothetical protein [Polyangiaceae bacterium]
RAALVKESLPKADELFAPKPESAPQAQANGALPPGHPPMPGVGGEDDAQLPPGHPQMPGSGAPGSPMSPMAHAGPSPEQVQDVADAVAQTERTPELESGLDKLTANAENDLDNGRYQEARDKMVRVMPMRPGDARTAADLGAAMAGLGKAEMAERVLTRALGSDPKQPRALFEMGKLLAARNDKAGARAKFEAVKASDAKFAAAHQVDSELSKL